MYLGICINNNDPQKRGRVQVFVPHIMPALYEGWNEQEADIDITCVGENLVNGMTSDLINRLSVILPWAEAASPIMGPSAPGALAVMESADGKSIQAGDFNQSPVPDPKEYGAITPYLNEIMNYAGTDARGNEVKASIGTSQGSRNCARGVAASFGADGIPQFMDIDKNGGCGFNARELALGGGNEHLLTNTGFFKAPVKIGNSVADFSSTYKPKNGDVIAASGGSVSPKDKERWGHVQRYHDPPGVWISDFIQGGILDKPNSNSSYEDRYTNFTLYEATPEGQALFDAKKLATVGKKAQLTKEYTSVSGEVDAQGIQSSSNPVNQDPSSPLYGSAANPDLTVNTTDNANNYSPQELRFAMMIAAAESGAGVMPVEYVTKETQDVPLAIGYSWGYGPGMTESETRAKGLEVIKAGASARTKGEKAKPFTWDKVDFGYHQSNREDGAKTDGTYEEQTYSTINLLRTINDNPKYAQQMRDSINSGEYSKAIEILTTRSLTPGTQYYALNSEEGQRKIRELNDKIETEYNGDVKAALAGINKQLPTIPTMEELIANGGQIDSDTLKSIAETNTTMVANIDAHGTMSSINLNNKAKGLFTYPSGGAMLWVFFREGNPQFPVYFAASYSQAEWASAYRYGSNGPGYKPATTDEDKLASVGGVWNTGVGGLEWLSQTDPTNFLNDEKSITLFGEDGSKLAMKMGCCDFFSKFDRRDHVEGDRFVRTLGYKEEWIQGSNNRTIMGHHTEKIGNCSQAAVDAVEQIQKLLLEIHEPLTRKT